MSIQLKKIVENIETLRGIYNKSGLPIKMSYTIAKNTAKIEQELSFYLKEKDKLIQKYAKRNNLNEIESPNGEGYVTIPPENLPMWEREHSELLSMDIEIDFFKFPEEELYNCSCSLTPVEILSIDFMIEEKKNTPKK